MIEIVPDFKSKCFVHHFVLLVVFVIICFIFQERVVFPVGREQKIFLPIDYDHKSLTSLG